ncbi:Nn.00g033050.m01.CDS01 [Neocucurbitaria sp. VM-36]
MRYLFSNLLLLLYIHITAPGSSLTAATGSSKAAGHTLTKISHRARLSEADEFISPGDDTAGQLIRSKYTRSRITRPDIRSMPNDDHSSTQSEAHTSAAPVMTLSPSPIISRGQIPIVSQSPTSDLSLVLKTENHKVLRSYTDLSTIGHSSTNGTVSNSVSKRSTNLYNLKLDLRNSEGYISVYMPNTTALAFCQDAPEEMSENPDDLKQDGSGVYYELGLGVGNGMAKVSVREDYVVNFCRRVWYGEKIGQSRSKTMAKPTKARLTTANTHAGSKTSKLSEHISIHVDSTLPRDDRSRTMWSSRPQTTKVVATGDGSGPLYLSKSNFTKITSNAAEFCTAILTRARSSRTSLPWWASRSQGQTDVTTAKGQEAMFTKNPPLATEAEIDHIERRTSESARPTSSRSWLITIMPVEERSSSTIHVGTRSGLPQITSAPEETLISSIPVEVRPGFPITMLDPTIVNAKGASKPYTSFIPHKKDEDVPHLTVSSINSWYGDINSFLRTAELTHREDVVRTLVPVNADPLSNAAIRNSRRLDIRGRERFIVGPATSIRHMKSDAKDTREKKVEIEEDEKEGVEENEKEGVEENEKEGVEENEKEGVEENEKEGVEENEKERVDENEKEGIREDGAIATSPTLDEPDALDPTSLVDEESVQDLPDIEVPPATDMSVSTDNEALSADGAFSIADDEITPTDDGFSSADRSPPEKPSTDELPLLQLLTTTFRLSPQEVLVTQLSWPSSILRTHDPFGLHSPTPTMGGPLPVLTSGGDSQDDGGLGEKEANSAAWGKIHDPKMIWTVILGWVLLGLEACMGFWEFFRNVRGDWHVGRRVVGLFVSR